VEGSLNWVWHPPDRIRVALEVMRGAGPPVSRWSRLSRLVCLTSTKWEALDDLVECRPTTLAGVVAMLDHLSELQFPDDEAGVDGGDDETVWSGAVGWGRPETAPLNYRPCWPTRCAN
jgi:hypothetical protein